MNVYVERTDAVHAIFDRIRTKIHETKQVATTLGITEQQVANFKFDFLSRLRGLIKKQGLSQDVFPELYDE